MPPTVQQAKVKSVLSGDTLILTAIGNPRNERTLSLAFVSAPRLRRGQEGGDEPYAIESRDFIRRLLVGKVIQFRVLYSLPTGTKRDYGTAVLQDGRSLPETLVSEGTVKLRDDAGKKEESEEAVALLARLKELEAKAKADNKGVWDAQTARIQTSYELPNGQEFAQKWKGQPLEAVVEKVLTGDRLIVRLAESATKHVQTMILLAGIRAPNTKRVNTSDGQEIPAEPFGEEAQEFVETRLLQRTVQVQILGTSPAPQNSLVASVKHPNGDIAVFELKAGLARCIDYHSTMLGQGMMQLRQAEKVAKDARLGVFKGAASSKGGAAGEADAVVSRVQAADTLFLRYPNGSEKRVNLSSVRQPKPSDPKQAPFGADAKEFLRRRLIGKHVKVLIDGKRPATEGYDEREMATVVQNKENIALALVQNGYASVLRHRMDDTDRSPIYDDLLAAELEAQQEQKGMWSPKAPEAKQYVDYSESLDKAKRLTTLLSRQKRVPAIVDFVKGGSRFTLLIPRENAKLTFVLSGINAPRSARNANEKDEPFGREAHELANRRLQQRDVEIDVEDNDKVGGFIGKLYVNRENFAKILLEEGFATVRLFSAEKSGNAMELQQAEQKAKDARKGVWHDYDPSKEEEAEAANGDAAAEDDTAAASSSANGTASAEQPAAQLSKDYRDILVTHIDPATSRLKFQTVSQGTTGALTSLTSQFRSFHLSGSSSTLAPSPLPPAVGTILAAKFSADGQWYRARVRRNDREAKTSEVTYIDYGNSETLAWNPPGQNLRQLGGTGADSKFGTQALRPQASEAVLSFVRWPVDLVSSEAGKGSSLAGYQNEAANWLFDNTGQGEKQMVARVDFTDPKDNTLYVTLFDPAAGDSTDESSVNALAVEDGFALVPKRPQRWEARFAGISKSLKAKEEEAKANRRGVWEYGDLTED